MAAVAIPLFPIEAFGSSVDPVHALRFRVEEHLAVGDSAGAHDEILHDPPLTRRLILDLLFERFRAGQPSADSILEGADTLLTALIDVAGVPEMTRLKGEIDQSLSGVGDFPDSAKSSDRLFRLYQRVIRAEAGLDVPEAVAACRLALALADSLDLPLSVAALAADCGYLLRHADDGDEPLAFMDRAIEAMATLRVPRFHSTMLLHRAPVLHRMGRPDDARSDIALARRTAEGVDDPSFEAVVTRNAGFFYWGRDAMDDTRACATRLRELADLTDDSVIRRAFLDIESAVAIDMDDMPAAIAANRELVETAPTDLGSAIDLFGLGNVLYMAGEFESAVDTLRLSIAILDTLEDIEAYESRARVLDLLGTVYDGMGMHLPAIEFTRQSLDAYRRLGWGSEVRTQEGYVGRLINRHAIALSDSGRAEEAIARYREALEWLEDTDHLLLRAAVWGNLAREYASIPDLAAAEQAYEAALAIAAELADPDEIDEILSGLSDVRHGQGSYAGAAEVYRRRAVASAEEGNFEGATLLWLHAARSLKNHLDLPRAGEAYERALVTARKIPDDLVRMHTLGVARNWRAMYYSDLDEPLLELEDYDWAIGVLDSLDTRLAELEVTYPDSVPAIPRRENLEMLMNVRFNRTLLMLGFGEEEALAEFEEIRDIYRYQLGQPRIAALSEIGIGQILQSDSPWATDAIHRHFQAAAAILDSIPPEYRDAEWHKSRGDVHAEIADQLDTDVVVLIDQAGGVITDEVIDRARQAQDAFRLAIENYTIADYSMGLVDAYAMSCRLINRFEPDVIAASVDSVMFSEIAETIRSARRIQHDHGLIRLLGHRARFAEVHGDEATAVADTREALDAIDRLVQRYASDPEGRQNVRGRFEYFYEGAVETFLRSELVTDAMEVIDRSKSQLLVEQIQSTGVMFDSPEKQAAFETLQKLLRQKFESEEAATREGAKPKAEQDPRQLARLRAERARAREEYSAYVQALLRSHPEILQYLSIQPANLQGLEDRLPDTMAVLEYLLLDDELVIFVALPGVTPTFRKVPIARTDLTARITRFRELLTAAVVAKRYRRLEWTTPASVEAAGESIAELVSLGSDLRSILIDPIEDLISGTEMLGISPSRTLHYLPFEALVRSDNGAARFLLEDYGVFYFTLANLLDVFGSFESVERSELSMLALAPTNADLPYATDEAQQVGGLFGSRAMLLVGDEATEDAALTHSGGRDILHFATHGWLREDDPDSSSLSMARPDSVGEGAGGADPFDPTDGRLTLPEIRGLDLEDGQLVTLSACETALGPQANGGEIMGLAQAFIRFGGGVPSVIASLWRVNDEGAAELMIRFYERLLDASNPVGRLTALRDAKLSLLSDPYFAHPYFWAPFILIGDCR